MKTRNEIIETIFTDKELEKLALRYDSNGDLWQQVGLYLCEMDEDNLQHIFNQGFLRYHVVSCITRSSLMYQNYVKFANKVQVTDQPIGDDLIIEEYSESITIAGKDVSKDELLHLVEHVAKLENTYDKELFLLITNGVKLSNGEIKRFNSISEISKATGISYTTLYNSYRKTLKRIYEKVENTISQRRSA